jgi:hypothetical protein
MVDGNKASTGNKDGVVLDLESIIEFPFIPPAVPGKQSPPRARGKTQD